MRPHKSCSVWVCEASPYEHLASPVSLVRARGGSATAIVLQGDLIWTGHVNDSVITLARGDAIRVGDQRVGQITAASTNGFNWQVNGDNFGGVSVGVTDTIGCGAWTGN